jgi:aldose 1-epimerase
MLPYICVYLLKAVWNATIGKEEVTFSHRSPDGDENFPGEIHAQVTFRLTEDNEIIISHTAEARDKPSPINMASQPYFNLAGEVSIICL